MKNESNLKTNEAGDSLLKFVGDKVIYDKEAQMIFGQRGKDLQLIADVRGWGAIQNLFKLSGGKIDFERAYKFQDQLGEFIAEAINEKLNK